MNLKGNSMRIAGIFLGLSVLWAAGAAAAERISLFDGKTLKGWTVLKCEAEVDNGEILIKAGNGLVQSEQKYGDFVLELDWKAMKQDKYDSGIYFRYDETMMSGKSPWPPRYQVNLRKGEEGNVAGVTGAKCDRTDLIKPGDWNHFKLTVRGAKVELEINGTPAWKGEGLAGPKEGFIALQAEVPGGGQFRFRNIYLTK
jgi:hypothetical protein